MFASLRKALSILGATNSARGVVSFNAYQGIPEGIYTGTYKQAMYSGLIPDLATARTAGGFTATGADASLTEKLLDPPARGRKPAGPDRVTRVGEARVAGLYKNS